MIAPSPYFQSVLILILLEVTQILVWMVVCAGIGVCLNPYSTGSNSNVSWKTMPNLLYLVLILILLEVTQIFTDKETVETVSECLNPYSTGSNSNSVNLGSVESTSVLILILLEVTQILWLSIIYFLLFVLYISHKVLLFNTIRYIPITFSQMYVLFLRKSIICLANIGLSA